MGYRGSNVVFPEDVHPEKPEGLGQWQASEARREERPSSGRLGDMLLRVALALPLAYLLYHLWQFQSPSYHNVSGVRFAEALALPAVSLLVGCVLVLSGRPTRWPWLIVAAGSVWLPFAVDWLLLVAWDTHGRGSGFDN